MATHYKKIPFQGVYMGSNVECVYADTHACFDNKSDVHVCVCVEIPTSDHKSVLPDTLTDINTQACNALTDQLILDKFTGKEGEVSFTRVQNATYPFMAFVGAGNPELVMTTKAPAVAKSIANVLHQTKAKHAIVTLPQRLPPRLVRSIFENLFLEISPDNRFRTAEKKRKTVALEKLTVYTDGDKETNKSQLSDALKTAEGIKFAQEIVGAPGNYCHPPSLADAAIEMARCCNLTAKVLEQDECEKLGMGAYLAVNKGSMYPPKFVHLTYTPTGPVKKKLAYIGKGVCFDSGGYNLKVNAMIELMKFDCGGGAAVFGAAKSIGMLRPTGVEVHFICAAAENMISHEAYRPGDILTASNGKTIEVGNTDAEGRLTLADALVYAEKLGVDEIVDIATLTGACMVALGNKCGGVWSTCADMADRIKQSGLKSGEMMWPMPLMLDYKKEMLSESKYADLNNVGSRFGGAIVAALFLKEFVEKTPWAHIDIAGPCWDHKEGMATGFGTRTLVEFAVNAGK